jgi:hypothetical protein
VLVAAELAAAAGDKRPLERFRTRDWPNKKKVKYQAANRYLAERRTSQSPQLQMNHAAEELKLATSAARPWGSVESCASDSCKMRERKREGWGCRRLRSTRSSSGRLRIVLGMSLVTEYSRVVVSSWYLCVCVRAHPCVADEG